MPKKRNRLISRRKKSAIRVRGYKSKLNPDRRVVIADKESAVSVIEDKSSAAPTVDLPSFCSSVEISVDTPSKNNPVQESED